MPDWYRNKIWSKDIEEMFFNKLNRARKDGRAQYLKVQALELISTKEELLLEIAETLIEKLFADYPENRIDRSIALRALGEIYKLRGNLEKALSFSRQAVDFESVFPNILTQAYVEYSELVLILKKVDQYDFITELLTKRSANSIFPVERYKVYTMLTALSFHKKDTKQAELYQRLADENANAQISELRYHKYLGVLQKRENKQLKNIAPNWNKR